MTAINPQPLSVIRMPPSGADTAAPADTTVVAPPPKATVYYNSACPVCRNGIAAQQAAMGDEAVAWVDVHRQPELVQILGLDLEAVRERLVVREADGTLHVGADAVSSLWTRTRGLRWLGRVLAWPLPRALARRGYDAFARVLYRWNRRHQRW